MPHIGVNTAQEQHGMQNRRLGSLLLMIGWILFAMAGLAGMFAFQDVREGTTFMLIGASALGVVGLLLIAFGTAKRRQM